MISEFGHMATASALMATLFLGGWDIPFWTGDDAFWYQGQLVRSVAADGTVVLASPTWWKTLLTFAVFAAKTGFFLVLYIWIRWTLPRFRYDQVMALGWKVMLPTGLAYVMLMGATILTLDTVGVPWGFGYGLALTAVSGVATFGFLFFIDRGRTITGAAPPPTRYARGSPGQRPERKTIPAAVARRVTVEEVVS
jgi:NADH-quinone oxidoreductase subunit H